MLRCSRFGVVALQETHHLSSEEGEAWAASGSGPLLAWPGVSFWSQGTSASCGVALLFRDSSINIAEEVTMRSQAPDGRYLVVDFCVGACIAQLTVILRNMIQQLKRLLNKFALPRGTQTSVLARLPAMALRLQKPAR